MARPTLSCLLPLVAVMPIAVMSTVISCIGPAPSTNASAFRANLLPLLSSLPYAAAPTGFASLRSGVSGRDFAYGRGLCFGDPVPYYCLGCLYDASYATFVDAADGTTKYIFDACGTAGVYMDGCFLSFTDTNVSSPSVDAIRSRVLTARGPVAHADDAVDIQKIAALAESLAPRAANSSPLMLATAAATVPLPRNAAVNSTVRMFAQCVPDRPPAD